MAIPGSLVSQQIREAYQAAERALEAERGQAASSSQAMQSLGEEREVALEDLAECYLPELSPAAVAEAREDARAELEQCLLRRIDHLARLENQLRMREDQRADAEAELEQTNRKLDELLDQQQALSEQLASTLAADDHFKRLAELAAEAEAELERAEASVEELERDAAEKLPAYENSRLFMYLWNRGFATPRYGSRGFTRRMDRWVSRLIDYPKAKSGYEYLKQVPEDVRQLVQRDRQALATVMDQLEAQRDEEAQRLGLPEVNQRVTEAQTERDRLLESLEQLAASIDAARRERADVEDVRGTYYRQALEHLKSLLQQSDLESLEHTASRTPDARDDQIVARLGHLDQRVRHARSEAATKQRRIESLSNHLSELTRFQQRFRAANFDSSRSEFDEAINLVAELENVREGHATIDEVWKRTRQRQRFASSMLASNTFGGARGLAQPLGEALIFAMSHAASHRMSDHARRAGQRVIQSRPAAPTPKPSPPSRGGTRFHTRNKI